MAEGGKGEGEDLRSGVEEGEGLFLFVSSCSDFFGSFELDLDGLWDRDLWW